MDGDQKRVQGEFLLVICVYPTTAAADPREFLPCLQDFDGPLSKPLAESINDLYDQVFGCEVGPGHKSMCFVVYYEGVTPRETRASPLVLVPLSVSFEDSLSSVLPGWSRSKCAITKKGSTLEHINQTKCVELWGTVGYSSKPLGKGLHQNYPNIPGDFWSWDTIPHPDVLFASDARKYKGKEMYRPGPRVNGGSASPSRPLQGSQQAHASGVPVVVSTPIRPAAIGGGNAAPQSPPIEDAHTHALQRFAGWTPWLPNYQENGPEKANELPEDLRKQVAKWVVEHQTKEPDQIVHVWSEGQEKGRTSRGFKTTFIVITTTGEAKRVEDGVRVRKECNYLGTANMWQAKDEPVPDNLTQADDIVDRAITPRTPIYVLTTERHAAHLVVIVPADRFTGVKSFNTLISGLTSDGDLQLVARFSFRAFKDPGSTDKIKLSEYYSLLLCSSPQCDAVEARRKEPSTEERSRSQTGAAPPSPAAAAAAGSPLGATPIPPPAVAAAALPAQELQLSSVRGLIGVVDSQLTVTASVNQRSGGGVESAEVSSLEEGQIRG